MMNRYIQWKERERVNKRERYVALYSVYTADRSFLSSVIFRWLDWAAIRFWRGNILDPHQQVSLHNVSTATSYAIQDGGQAGPEPFHHSWRSSWPWSILFCNTLTLVASIILLFPHTFCYDAHRGRTGQWSSLVYKLDIKTGSIPLNGQVPLYGLHPATSVYK